jgi:hypothetical protein
LADFTHFQVLSNVKMTKVVSKCSASYWVRACIPLDGGSLWPLAELAENAQLIIFYFFFLFFFTRSPEKKWVHENVSFRSAYDGQLQLCMYPFCG